MSSRPHPANTLFSSYSFLPIILRNDMGYSVALAQILAFPPYVVAAIWMFTTAWIADHYRKRGFIIIWNCAVAIVGVCMMTFVSHPATRYAGVFLGVCGANSNVPSLLSYMHNNIVGQMKRSIASALLIGGGACGGTHALSPVKLCHVPEEILNQVWNRNRSGKHFPTTRCTQIFVSGSPSPVVRLSVRRSSKLTHISHDLARPCPLSLERRFLRY